MTSSPPSNPDPDRDAALWAALRAAQPRQLDAPSRDELAAWLDDRLDPADRDALEARLADHPEALDAVVDARELAESADSAHPLVASDVLARAYALVGTAAAPEVTVLPRSLRWLQYVATTAAVLGVCVMAYRLGGSATPGGTAPATNGLLAEVSFGVLDEDVDDASTVDDILLVANVMEVSS